MQIGHKAKGLGQAFFPKGAGTDKFTFYRSAQTTNFTFPQQYS